MAGSRKEYELLFKLKASLGGNFNSTFQNAISTTKEMQGTLNSIKRAQADISGYKKQMEAVESTRSKLATLQSEYEALQREERVTGKSSDELARKYERNQQEIWQTGLKIQDQENKLKELNEQLKRAGINTGNLSETNRRLENSYDRVQRSQENYARLSAQQGETYGKIQKTRGELMQTAGVIGAVGTALYLGPVTSAKEFQSSMADVIKVVDGLKDSSGELTQEYYQLTDELLAMTKIPISESGLADIAASAGQAGIARKEIALFTEDAAKMGIAFDIAAKDAGDYMAKWRTAFKFDEQEQVVVLADQINYLSNKMAATAEEISVVTTKIGPLGEVAGYASGEIAAMGATLLAVGVNQDVAATGIKKVMTSMTAGEGATKRQAEVLDKLGMSATDLAERMQVDAKGAIVDFMKAINNLPKAEQVGTLKYYFGEESIGAIAPLLTNLDKLELAFGYVGDSAFYAGSMEGEFIARSDTVENKMITARKSINTFSIELGETFLPMVGQGAEQLTELMISATEFTKANPELVQSLVKVGAGLGAFTVATQGTKLAYEEIKFGVEGVGKTLKFFRGEIEEAGANAELGQGRITRAGKGIKDYFGGIKSAFGSVDGALSQFSVFESLSGVFKNGMGSMTDILLSPFQMLGNKANGILSPFKNKTLGFFGDLVGSIVNGPLGKIGGVVQSLGGVISSVVGPLGSIFGGLATKAMPFVLILSALSALFIKLSGGDTAVFMEPLLLAFEQAKPILEAVGEQFKALGQEMLPLLIDAANQLAPLFGEIVGSVLPVLLALITQLTPVITEIIRQVLPIVLDLLTQLSPILTDLITMVLPIIVDLINLILPLLAGLIPVIQVVASVISSVLIAAFTSLQPVMEGMTTALGGLIKFITGVFTGDWKKAWEGVRDIFGGIFDSLFGLAKTPFNMIIGGINGLFDGLRKVDVPDWVPGIGGKSMDLNLPKIPMFAKGSNYTPDTFIAGEAGAELITNASGRKVFTAMETGNIFKNIIGVVSSLNSIGVNQPQFQLAYAGGKAPSVQEPSVLNNSSSKKENKFEIKNETVIHINGDKPNDLDNKLDENYRKLLMLIQEILDRDDRGKYD